MKAMAAGDHPLTGQGPEIDPDRPPVHLQDAGDLALSNGFIQPEQDHQHDRRFLQGTKQIHFSGVHPWRHD
jgi:hypothetical protein